MSDWRPRHENVIKDVLKFINSRSDKFILKGGTALKQCYGLDRFSEDIDFNAEPGNDLRGILDEYLKVRPKYGFTIMSDTDTTQRYMLHYGDPKHPVKIEISHKLRSIDPEDLANVGGTQTYGISALARQKAAAYRGRDKIRDVYDILFIVNSLWDKLDRITQGLIKNDLMYKGIDDIDMMINDQPDELIDPEMLANKALDAFDKLGILDDSPRIKPVPPRIKHDNCVYCGSELDAQESRMQHSIFIGNGVSEQQLVSLGPILGLNFKKEQRLIAVSFIDGFSYAIYFWGITADKVREISNRLSDALKVRTLCDWELENYESEIRAKRREPLMALGASLA